MPKQPRDKKPSFKWITLQDVADHFCVSEITIRKGRGVFGALRRVPVGRRTLILRADVEKLDRALERAACSITPAI